MKVTENREYILVGIVISILIHVVMIFIIGSTKYSHASLSKPFVAIVQSQDLSKNKGQKQPVIQANPLPQEKKTAYLTPGSPVWFKNNAPAVVQKAPDNRTNNIPSAVKITVKQPLPQQKEIKATSLVEESPVTQEKKEAHKQQDEQKAQKKQDEQKEQKIIPEEAHVKTAIKKQAQQAEAKEKQSAQAEIFAQEKQSVTKLRKKTLIKTLETTLPSIKDQQSSMAQPKITDQTEQLMPPMPLGASKNNKGGLSLKGLQIGFTKFLRQGNNDIMHREGDRNTDPTPADLKLMSYYRQVGLVIESTLQFIGRIDIKNLVPDKNIYYTLVIERDGTISDCNIFQKSTHDVLNAHAEKILKNLGSLPPLPHYIEAPHLFSSGFTYFHEPLRFYR